MVLGALLAIGCVTSPRATAAWEYRVIQGVTHSPEFEEKLNQAGSEGFTIDSATFIRGGEHTQHQVLVILKRVRR